MGKYLMLLVLLLSMVVHLVHSISICSNLTHSGRTVQLSGNITEDRNCSCSYKLASVNERGDNTIYVVEAHDPDGCQYGLQFKFRNRTRDYNCNTHGNTIYTNMNITDVIQIDLQPGPSKTGGFNFTLELFASKGTYADISCSTTHLSKPTTAYSISTQQLTTYTSSHHTNRTTPIVTTTPTTTDPPTTRTPTTTDPPTTTTPTTTDPPTTTTPTTTDPPTTATPTTTDPSSANTEYTLSTTMTMTQTEPFPVGAVIGGIIGGLVIIVVPIAVFCFIQRRRNDEIYATPNQPTHDLHVYTTIYPQTPRINELDVNTGSEYTTTDHSTQDPHTYTTLPPHTYTTLPPQTPTSNAVYVNSGTDFNTGDTGQPTDDATYINLTKEDSDYVNTAHHPGNT